MSDPFIAEIIMFGGNFAPRGWALCDGQLLPISSNSALFSILGTTYGGDGRTTFALPDLRGRAAIHPGSGPGLSTYRLGQKAGVENVNLSINQIPSHTHQAKAFAGAGNKNTAAGSAWSDDAGVSWAAYSSSSPNADMHSGAIANAGGSQPHTNIQPVLCVNFIIALVGVFPSRN
jgi:microcystin-dependent protein